MPLSGDKIDYNNSNILFSYSSSSTILFLVLSIGFLGFDLSLQPQHGQCSPSHLINNAHIAHLFCPAEYLPPPPEL